MCNEQLQIRWKEVASLISDARLEVACDALRFGDDNGSMTRSHDLFCGLSEEFEPAVEVARLERELEVSHHGVAFVAAGGEHDSGPEVFEQSEMGWPVLDLLIEDGADFGVELNLGVEAVYQV